MSNDENKPIEKAALPEPSKPWWQSRGVWGSFVAVGAGVMNAVANIDLTQPIQAELVDIFVSGGTIVGGVIALIGRIRAVAAIIFSKK